MSSIHGIFDEDLLQEESFEEVYCHFCNWIKLNVKVFSEEVGLTHYPGNIYISTSRRSLNYYYRFFSFRCPQWV